MQKLLKTICAAAAVGVLLPLGVLAAASTPPDTLVDLTTTGSAASGSVVEYSSAYANKRYNGTKAFDGGSGESSRWLAKKADNRSAEGLSPPR